MPAYQDYTIRARVSELLLGASGARTAVTEACQANGARDRCREHPPHRLDPVDRGGTTTRRGYIVVTATAAIGTTALVELTADWNGTTADWSCTGTPAEVHAVVLPRDRERPLAPDKKGARRPFFRAP